jgi:hypothetical protein
MNKIRIRQTRQTERHVAGLQELKTAVLSDFEIRISDFTDTCIWRELKAA